MQEKLYFRQVCKYHNISNTGLQQIAQQSGVAKSIVDTMHVGTPVARSDAVRVLDALTKLTSMEYTLNNVAVPLSDLRGNDV